MSLNIYSNPEHFGVTLVGTVDLEHGYEYDVIAVWKTADGRFLRGHSSGCSCSSPFEYDGVDDQTWTTPEEFQAYALDYADKKRASWPSLKEVWKMEITELFERMVKP